MAFHIFNGMTPAYDAIELYVTYLEDRNATVVEIGFHDVVVTGSSKRAPGDPVRPEVGKTLALARALRNLADRIESELDV